MARISVRYFVTRKSATRPDRHYWQPDTALRDAGWKNQTLSENRAEAMKQAEEINDRVDAWRLDNTGPKNERPGSIDAIITQYKQSRDFKKLRPQTQTDYTRYLNAISQWAGDEPAIMINAKMVATLYETKLTESPRKAMYLIQVLRLLFGFAERQSLIPRGSNPAAKQKLEYSSEKGALWTRDAIRIYAAAAEQDGEYALATAIILNEWLGQRPGDLVAINKSMYADGCIIFAQSKTGSEVTLPVDMVPHLAARLAAQLDRNKTANPKSSALFIGQSGHPLTANGLRQAFKRIKAKVIKQNPDREDLADLVMQTLRHTAITRMAESGCTELEISAISGHKIQGRAAIIDRYNVRTKKLAEQAFQKRIDAEASIANG